MIFKYGIVLVMLSSFPCVLSNPSAVIAMSVTTTASESNEVRLHNEFKMTCSYENLRNELDVPSITWKKMSKCTPNREVFIYTSAGQGTAVTDGYGVEPQQFTSTPNPDGKITLQENKMNNEMDPGCFTFIYVCEIKSYEGTRRRPTANIYNASTEITIVDPPKIVVISEDTTVTEGDNITLLCETSGIPLPEVNWTRLNNLPLPGGGLVQRGNQGHLEISQAIKEHSGVYICSTINRLLTSPIIKSVTIVVNYKPHVSTDSLVVFQQENYHTELLCRAEAFPSIQTSGWFHKQSYYGRHENPVMISDNDTRLIIKHENTSNYLISKLIIEPVKSPDYDTFFCCFFSNEKGTSEKCFDIERSNYPVMVGGEKPRKLEQISQSVCSLPTLLIFFLSLILSITFMNS